MIGLINLIFSWFFLKEPKTTAEFCRRHPEWHSMIRAVNCTKTWKAIQYEMFKDGKYGDGRVTVFQIFYNDVMYDLASRGNTRLALDITKENFAWLKQLKESDKYIYHMVHCLRIQSEIVRWTILHCCNHKTCLKPPAVHNTNF